MLLNNQWKLLLVIIWYLDAAVIAESIKIVLGACTLSFFTQLLMWTNTTPMHLFIFVSNQHYHFDYIFLASVLLHFIAKHLSKFFIFLFYRSFPMVEIFPIIWVFHIFIKFWLLFLLSAREFMFNNLWSLFPCLSSSLLFASDVNKMWCCFSKMSFVWWS